MLFIVFFSGMSGPNHAETEIYTSRQKAEREIRKFLKFDQNHEASIFSVKTPKTKRDWLNLLRQVGNGGTSYNHTYRG